MTGTFAPSLRGSAGDELRTRHREERSDAAIS
jgi:hypothetical protein